MINVFTTKKRQFRGASRARQISRRVFPAASAIAAGIVFGVPLFAQASPWETAVNNLQTSFTGPIAKGLSLVAIVIGGLMFAYSEGASKKMFSGIVFGLGMALGAANFMAWMFP